MPTTSVTSNSIDLKIPDGVKKIPPFAYKDDTELLTVSIPASVVEIGEYAFDGCDNITEFIVSTDNECFSNDEYGTLYNKAETELLFVPPKQPMVSLPLTATSIHPHAFDGYTGRCMVLCSEEQVPMVRAAASSCKWRAEILIEEDGVLYDEHKTSIVTVLYTEIPACKLPDGITDIDSKCFADCTELKKIFIPSSVTHIAKDAFRACPKVMIVAPEGSYAIAYAKANGFLHAKV